MSQESAGLEEDPGQNVKSQHPICNAPSHGPVPLRRSCGVLRLGRSIQEQGGLVPRLRVFASGALVRQSAVMLLGPASELLLGRLASFLVVWGLASGPDR